MENAIELFLLIVEAYHIYIFIYCIICIIYIYILYVFMLGGPLYTHNFLSIFSAGVVLEKMYS